ncbi:MAG: hypothetical protein ABI624_04845 [Casimicrobiaceae bacterium]
MVEGALLVWYLLSAASVAAQTDIVVLTLSMLAVAVWLTTRVAPIRL